MLEVTIVGFHGDNRELKTFQFENDALQTYLTECSANEHGCQITSLRALGVPLTVTGDEPKRQRYGAEADAARADASKARLNQPISRTRAPIDESQPTARTAGPGSVRSAVPTEQPTIKPKTEKL